MAKTEKTTSSDPGITENVLANLNITDTEHGFTSHFYLLEKDIRCYSRFIATLVRFNLVSVMLGRILASNFSQRKFNELRDGSN